MSAPTYPLTDGPTDDEIELARMALEDYGDGAPALRVLRAEFGMSLRQAHEAIVTARREQQLWKRGEK